MGPLLILNNARGMPDIFKAIIDKEKHYMVNQNQLQVYTHIKNRKLTNIITKVGNHSR